MMPGNPDASAYAMPTGTSIVVITRPATMSWRSQEGSYRRRTSSPGTQRVTGGILVSLPETYGGFLAAVVAGAQTERAVSAKVVVANALERERVRSRSRQLWIESERALLEVIADVRDALLLRIDHDAT